MSAFDELDGKSGDWTPVDLKCDCCASPMVMQRYERGGASFACQKCEQRWCFAADGRTTCTVLARLYPSRMKQTDALYQEFLDYKLAECAFYLDASVLCGLMTTWEAESKMEGCRKLVADKRRELVVIILPWWKRWYAAAVQFLMKLRNRSHSDS